MFLWQLTTSWHKELRIPSPVCFDLKGIEFDHDDYEIRKHSHLHRRHRRHQAAAPADPAATEDDTSLKSKHESDQVKREEDAPTPKADPPHGWVITKPRHCSNWTDDHGASHQITSEYCEMMQKDQNEFEEETAKKVEAIVSNLYKLQEEQANGEDGAEEPSSEQ